MKLQHLTASKKDASPICVYCVVSATSWGLAHGATDSFNYVKLVSGNILPQCVNMIRREPHIISLELVSLHLPR